MVTGTIKAEDECAAASRFCLVRIGDPVAQVGTALRILPRNGIGRRLDLGGSLKYNLYIEFLIQVGGGSKGSICLCRGGAGVTLRMSGRGYVDRHGERRCVIGVFEPLEFIDL